MTETDIETRSVTLERRYPYPPDRVWRALTTSELIGDWLMQTDFRPEVGHRFAFTADWGTVDCEVLEVVPQRRLAYSWNAGDLQSTVTWTLAPDGEATLLRMDQTGFRPDQPRYYGGAKMGWPRFLDALGGVLDRLG